MEVLYFAFADNAQNPLPALQREADELFRLLSPGAAEHRYQIVREQYATREKVIEHLTQYQDSISLFHYSGHAGSEGLLTEEESTHADGIAHLLGQCKNLKWVFLNGCSTEGQVNQLWDMGVPGIIATHAEVEDEKATLFSIRFYQSLSLQKNATAAFESAKGEVLSMRKEGQPKLDIAMHRSLFWLKENKKSNPQGTWGTFVQEKNADVLTWKLPEIAVLPPSDSYVPNVELINTLVESLVPYNKTIRFHLENEKEGEPFDFAEKRLAILNSLPAPIAEHLRKLMVPLTDKDKGYDKVGHARIEQLSRTYNATLELFFFSMLAQLWSVLEEKTNLNIPVKNLEIIRHFFTIDNATREYYDYIPAIKGIREIFDINEVPYFIEELEEVKKSYAGETPFYFACEFLDSLKKQLANDEIPHHEVPAVCHRAEKSLCEVFRNLIHMAKYTLAAVRKIDVLKYRHSKIPTFRHSLVNLIKLMGGLEEKNEELKHFMDSRSVLLLKRTANKVEFLNLSPFIIDENAFDDRTTGISKVFFFHHYDKLQDKYMFLHAGKPDDLPLVVSENNEKFALVKIQFEAFFELLFNQRSKRAA